MIQLAEETFDTRNDPAQISITQESAIRLRNIHPSTLTEKKDRNGPIAWVAVIPTTHEIMGKFITKKINEQELMGLTPPRGKYDALYLCSALVLPEHRRKGLAKRLMIKAIRSICRQHPIKHLFYWAFSAEGKGLAATVAREMKLPLHRRPD